MDNIEKINYLAYPNKFTDKEKKLLFKQIIEKFNPDIIHIFGTEIKHSLNMIQVCKELKLLDKTLINIQGLCSKIAKAYYADLPERVVKSFTLRDLIRKDNIFLQKKKYEKRGLDEIETLKIAHNVIGRTEWDFVCVKQHNPNINYYFCNATLRDSFYVDKWDYNRCEKHSIFVSQCNYPIKGFHKLLQAMPLILQKYPDAKIYTTGKNLINLTFKEKLKLGAYQKYLIKLIKQNNLENKIKFLGMLSEEQMKKAYLNSNCFVSCSSIENECNSLGEAMILGVPSVSSYVGGITSEVSNGNHVYLYPFNEEYMLAYYVCKLFEDKECKEITQQAIKNAEEIYNKEKNAKTLVEIYQKLIGDNSEYF